jgi:hypothetical protein
MQILNKNNVFSVDPASPGKCKDHTKKKTILKELNKKKDSVTVGCVTEFFDVTPHIQHQEYKTR